MKQTTITNVHVITHGSYDHILFTVEYSHGEPKQFVILTPGIVGSEIIPVNQARKVLDIASPVTV